MGKKNMVEFSYLVTPDDVTYCFEDGVDTFLITDVNPLGMPPLDIETQRSPFQHGETALNYSLKPRVLTLVQRRQGKTRQDYWDLRADMIDHIRPNRQTTWGAYEPCQLIRELPDGMRWALDVYFVGGLEFRSSVNWDEWSAQEAIRFTAYDPTFYDPEGDSITLSLTLTGNELAFPIDFPIIFQAEDTLDDSDIITYPGNWQTFPVIEIDGPASDTRITNIDTGELLNIQYTIPLADTVTIDCRSGRKTVTDLAGNNLIGTLSDDSDLGTFHLAPNPESPGGQNTIHAFALDVATGVTEIRFSYSARMVGI